MANVVKNILLGVLLTSWALLLLSIQAEAASKDTSLTLANQKIAKLEARLKKLEDERSMKAPFWAKDIAQEAYDKHWIDSVDGHSLDFYKVLNMMFQAGAL